LTWVKGWEKLAIDEGLKSNRRNYSK
jgi:hypothetical protein